jgi:hypothetical protein
MRTCPHSCQRRLFGLQVSQAFLQLLLQAGALSLHTAQHSTAQQDTLRRVHSYLQLHERIWSILCACDCKRYLPSHFFLNAAHLRMLHNIAR